MLLLHPLARSGVSLITEAPPCISEQFQPQVFHRCEQAGVKISSKSDPLGFSFFFYRPELRDVTDDVTVDVTDEFPLNSTFPNR